MAYKPKLFKRERIKEATIILHNFNYSAETICRGLGIKNRGSNVLIFTVINGIPMILFVKLLEMRY